MIRVAVCDDNQIERQITTAFCARYLNARQEAYILKEYASGEEFLADDEADVLLLDVKMKRIDGILLKDILRIMRLNTRIIFISNDKRYMKDAFGKNVYAFLEKPIEYTNFSNVMKIVVDDTLAYRNYVYCREIVDYEKIYRKIYIKDIVYVEADGHKSCIYIEMGRKCVISDKRIGEWKRDYVNRGLLCCHRSYMVNPLYVVHIDKEIELMSGQRIPLARERRNTFRKEFRAYRLQHK